MRKRECAESLLENKSGSHIAEDKDMCCCFIRTHVEFCSPWTLIASSCVKRAISILCLCLSPEEGEYFLKVLIPSYAAGSIIGKGGQTIVQLQKETGATIKLSKSKDFYPGKPGFHATAQLNVHFNGQSASSCLCLQVSVKSMLEDVLRRLRDNSGMSIKTVEEQLKRKKKKAAKLREGMLGPKRINQKIPIKLLNILFAVSWFLQVKAWKRNLSKLLFDNRKIKCVFSSFLFSLSPN